MKESTKRCRQCGGVTLISFTSMHIKRCSDCGHEMPWHLEAGQKPLIGPSRTMRRDAK